MGIFVPSYESATPATPATSTGNLFPKTDGHLYWQRADGTIFQLDSGSSSSAPNIITITWASTITVNFSGQPNGTIFRCTLAGNTTINISGGTDGQKAQLELLQDATGNRLVTLSSSFAFGTDIASFTATTTASKTDYLGINFDGTSAKYRIIALVKGY